MNKKISQFDVATSLNTGDILTIVQEGTNKQISKEACLASHLLSPLLYSYRAVRYQYFELLWQFQSRHH